MIKNWRSAAILLAVLLALGGLATWDEWKTKQDEKAKETDNKLLALKSEDIIGLTLHSLPDPEAGGDKTAKSAPADAIKITEVTLKLVDGKWAVTSPVSEAADQQTVQDLVKNILDYKYEKDVTSGKDQWAQYGLNEPRRRIELENKDGSKTTLFVGINSPVGYSVYIATDKSDKVYAGSQYIATSTAKTLFDFRDKKVIAVNTADLASVQLTHSGSKQKPLELTRKDGKWSITAPEAADADTAQVNNFLDDISGLRASEFIDTPSKDQVAAFAKKEKLFADIRFTTTKAEVQELKIAQMKDGLFAAVDPSKKIIKLGEDAKAKLSKNVNDLRDKKIFQFQSAQVESVDVDSKEYVRVKDEWYTKEDAAKFDKEGKFTGKDADKPTAKPNLRGLLVDLEYAKADDVLGPDSAAVKKLSATPKNRIKLNFGAATSQPPLTIDIWQTGESPDQIYVRPSGSPKLYKAKASIIASINDAPKLPAEDAKFPPLDGAAPQNP